MDVQSDSSTVLGSYDSEKSSLNGHEESNYDRPETMQYTCSRRHHTVSKLFACLNLLLGLLLLGILCAILSIHRSNMKHIHLPQDVGQRLLPEHNILPMSEDYEWQDCGSSIDEARAKGCVFDVMLVAWVRKDCFDSQLMERYLSEVDYPYWIDRSLQTPITLDEFRFGDHETAFSNQEFHMAHCAYFMEQSVRNFRDRPFVDNVTLDNDHTVHCAKTLRDHWLPEMGYSPLHMDWHSCGKRRNLV